MPTASGLDAQIGIVAESTYGTYAAPTRFYELLNEKIKYTRQRIARQGIRPGRRLSHAWAAGVGEVTGPFSLELVPQDLGLLLAHAIATPSTAGVNPFTHTYTPGTIGSDRSLTIQVGRPDAGGTVRAFSYLGCTITEWDIAAEVNAHPILTCSVYGAHEDTGQSLAPASFDAAYAPFTWAHASCTVAGANMNLISASFRGANELQTGRHRITNTTPERPKQSKEQGRRDVGGSLVADFEDLTAYNRFVNGTEAALVLSFNAGASAQLTITANVRYDGETTEVPGREVLRQPLPFMCTSGTSDAAAFTLALVNADATP